MTSKKNLKARGHRDVPGSGPNYDKAHGLAPTKPDPPKDGKYPYAPAPLMDLVFKFLNEFGYKAACHQIKIQTQKRESTGGYTKPCSWTDAGKDAPALIRIWKEWEQRNPSFKWQPESELLEMRRAQLVASASQKGELENQGAVGKAMSSDSESSSEEDSDEDGEVSNSKGQNTASKIALPESESSSEEDSDEGGEVLNSKGQREASKIALPESDSESNVDSGSSDTSDSDEGSDSEADEPEDAARSAVHTSTKSSAITVPAANLLKRKAADSSSEDSSSISESGSGASSSSDSDSDEEPRTKKLKVKQADSSGDSGSSSEDTDSDESSNEDKMQVDSSDSESDSDEDSSSDNGKKSDAADTKASVAPSSLSETAAGRGRQGSESSATLHATSPQFAPSTFAPNAAASGSDSNRHSNSADSGDVKKGPNGRFQRVASDTKIDPKFASNQYVSYDYADRAHRDLSIVKGKGFTKEKNKKKRGSYKGGIIDTSGGRSIKFED